MFFNKITNKNKIRQSTIKFENITNNDNNAISNQLFVISRNNQSFVNVTIAKISHLLIFNFTNVSINNFIQFFNDMFEIQFNRRDEMFETRLNRRFKFVFNEFSLNV